MAISAVGATLGLAAGLTTALGAQTLRGAVLGDLGRTPIPGATVVARGGGAATTDRLGRFVIGLRETPDTLVVTAIGWVPDTIVVAATLAEPLIITLAQAPVIISELIATAIPKSTPDLSSHGRWQMPMQAARTVPPAVETDVYRALVLIPAVSFTSPLSARPLIRGYDAQEVVTRIDGFEVINLFHLGRIFSSYPADATDEIGVTIAPFTSANGGSVTGIIDIVGRTGPVDQTNAGGGFSFGSLSGYAGSGNRRLRSFGTARFFHIGALRLIPGLEVPYHFEDFYGGLVLGPPERPMGRFTLFATQDRAGDTAKDLYLNWDNLVLGTRWRVVDRGQTNLELAASAARFRESGEDVPGLRTTGSADIENRFGRVALTADLISTRRATRLGAGLSLGWRTVGNRIGEATPGSTGAPRFLETAADFSRPEFGGYAEATRALGPLALGVGLRADVAGPVTSVQPRVHARWTIAPRVEASAGIGRTSRLYHLLAEAQSEPDFDFLDFWMNPGDSVPVARVDHVTLDVTFDVSPLVARTSAYDSRGVGIGELRPESDQRQRQFDFFRFGRSRTRGIEAQLGLRGTADRPHSLSVTYVYSISERDWGQGWIRWAQDRRHQVRAFGQLQVARLTLFGVADATTGMPATPIDFQFVRGIPGLPDQTGSPFGGFRDFGRENSVGTSGTFRVDAGFNWTLGRPGKTLVIVGLAVINLLQTEVAPISRAVGDGTLAVDQRGNATPYRRLFRLPGVPTITVRVAF